MFKIKIIARVVNSAKMTQILAIKKLYVMIWDLVK